MVSITFEVLLWACIGTVVILETFSGVLTTSSTLIVLSFPVLVTVVLFFVLAGEAVGVVEVVEINFFFLGAGLVVVVVLVLVFVR